MIHVGLTGWGDHHSLYADLTNKKDKLTTYASHFPIVELDATYYAVQRQETIEKWCDETHDTFKFIVKAHQYMTGHGDYRAHYDSIKDVFTAFTDMLKPMHQRGKLAFVLLQFPPWFECNPKNIRYVKFAVDLIKPYKIAVEFRNQTWFSSSYTEGTLNFLHDNNVIHSICDEPQAGQGCIPFVNRVTDSTAFIRLHGRNVHGWTQKDRTSEEWRTVRYLYDYNADELAWLKKQVDILKHKTKDIYIVFNNNSGGHAAGNAESFLDIMKIKYEGLSPKQLKLF
ncbi:DUF72 domain-containing protein [Corticicoccus populi]|uniref:DUF72 domain-containing protein n=1 Tax=Corticicoccus populi TaxID=1812821 RepID=A0ABW5WUY0_9STAP